MRNLELEALANALNAWGLTGTVTGMAGAGEVDVLVTGTTRDYVLVIDEPVVFVRDSALVPAVA